jgi:hypothetical protein
MVTTDVIASERIEIQSSEAEISGIEVDGSLHRELEVLNLGRVPDRSPIEITSNLYTLRISKGTEGYKSEILEEGEFAWQGAQMGEIERAIGATLREYHSRANDLKPSETIQLIDPVFLYRYPQNILIYQDDVYSDIYPFLRKSLDVQYLYDSDRDDVYLVPIVVSSTGAILSGNRRWFCVTWINQLCIENGLPRKYPKIPVIVKKFSSEEQELEAVILENRSRVKTKLQITNEIRALKELKEISARKRRIAALQGRTEEVDSDPDKGKTALEAATEEIANSTGVVVKKSEAQSRLNVQAKLEEIQDPELLKMAKALFEHSTTAAVDLLQKTPQLLLENGKGNEPLQKAVCEILQRNPSLSVKKALKKVYEQQALEEAERLPPSEENKDNPIATALKLGDVPSNNWFTPDEIVDLFLQVMDVDRFDWDVFSDMTKRIPAKNHLTIVEDALAKEKNADGEETYLHDIKGKVFSNILYDRTGECLKLFDYHLSRGSIEELALVCPSDVLFNKQTQAVIRKHNMTACAWRGRIPFIKGDLLKHWEQVQGKQAKESESNRTNSVLLYYGKHQENFELGFGDEDKGMVWFPGETVHEIAVKSQDTIKKPVWIGNECEFMDYKLKVQTDTSGTGFVYSIDGDINEEEFYPTDREAKAAAMGSVILMMDE